MVLLSQRKLEDYRTELAIGRVFGRSGVNVSGHNVDVNATEETLCDNGGDYTDNYLPSNTTLYLSSTDAGDTNVDVATVGMNDSGVPGIAAANSNGQNQVALDVQLWRTFQGFVAGPVEPAGDLYISSELGNLTAGVPDDPTKIMARIAIDGSGNKNNYTRMGLITIPANKFAVAKTVRGSVGKGHDAVLIFRMRLAGGVWWRLNPFQLYQGPFEFHYPFAGIVFPPLTDIELRAVSTVNSAVSVEIDGEYV